MQIYSCQEPIEDARQLQEIIEENHPDSYIHSGGKVAFHLRFEKLLASIAEAGVTASELARLLVPFVAAVYDAPRRQHLIEAFAHLATEPRSDHAKASFGPCLRAYVKRSQIGVREHDLSPMSSRIWQASRNTATRRQPSIDAFVTVTLRPSVRAAIQTREASSSLWLPVRLDSVDKTEPKPPRRRHPLDRPSSPAWLPSMRGAKTPLTDHECTSKLPHHDDELWEDFQHAYR